MFSKGTVQAQTKNLQYSFVSDEIFPTFVKSKIKRGNGHEFFLHFLLRKQNELLIENVKKGVRGNEPNGRTAQPTQLIPKLIEGEFCAPQNYRSFYF